MDSITVEDIQAVAAALVARAKAGEVAAIRELLDRILGKVQHPTESVEARQLEVTPELQRRAEDLIRRLESCGS